MKVKRKKKILSESAYRDKVYKQAEKVRVLADFRKLWAQVKESEHDYGTIVYAASAMMKAAFNLTNRSKVGGMTGFQASFLGWEMVKEFFMLEDGAPAKILKYEELLYPQYEQKFEKQIDEKTWEWLKETAAKKLKGADGAESVRSHWKSIVDGKLPFGYKLGDQ